TAVSLSNPSAVPDKPTHPAWAGALRTKQQAAAINDSTEQRTNEIIGTPLPDGHGPSRPGSLSTRSEGSNARVPKTRSPAGTGLQDRYDDGAAGLWVRGGGGDDTP